MTTNNIENSKLIEKMDNLCYIIDNIFLPVD
jgi:hypothetical protein